MRKLLKLNSFWIRIIALITMTIDHIGVFLDYSKFYPLRIIGRIALPLFVFLSVEGALKTSNKKKYLLRLLSLFVSIGVILTAFSFMGSFFEEIAYTSGNIFFDLLLVILTVFILESDNKKIKPLVALPILYSIFSFTVIKLESCGCDGLYTFFPPALRMQYGIFTMLLTLGFYASNKLVPILINKYSPINADDDDYKRLLTNFLCVITVVISGIILMLTNYAFGDAYTNMLEGIQTYAIISAVFIMLYNGKKGYNSKWFRVAYYLYYPIHIGIILLFFL